MFNATKSSLIAGVLAFSLILSACNSSVGDQAQFPESSNRSVADVLKSRSGERDTTDVRIGIGKVSRELLYNENVASLGRFVVSREQAAETGALESNYRIEIVTEDCESRARCGLTDATVRVDLAVFTNTFQQDQLTIVSGEMPVPTGLSGWVDVKLVSDVPALQPGLNCLLLLTTVRIVNASGELVASTRVDSSRAFEVDGTRPLHCNLLAGSTEIDPASIEVKQEGPDFDCGSARLLSSDGAAPLADASTCSNEQVLLVIRVDLPPGSEFEYAHYRIPAMPLDQIVEFSLPESLFGEWQPVLFSKPDELEATAAPSHSISSWQAVNFSQDAE